VPTKMNKALFLASFSLVLLLVSGCSTRLYSGECWNFTSLPPEQQHARFQNQPLEKQLDLYLCKMDEEPPGSEYADPIAEHGTEAIPVVLAKMKKVDETEKARLLYLMEVISDRGYLRHRTDVYAELSQMVEGMNEINRQRCDEILKKIAINSGIKQFTYTSMFRGCGRGGRI
jgi:hypothetical protein